MAQQLELRNNARWGSLPFDIFVLEKWDPASPDSPETQWAHLAKTFGFLGAAGRHPYNSAVDRARVALSQTGAIALPVPSEQQITDILQPLQTTQERNISATFTYRTPPIMLRTCYVPGSDGRFDSLLATCDEPMDIALGPNGNERVLDDYARYDFGEDWDRVFVFLPGLMDGWKREGDGDGNREDDRESEQMRINMCKSDAEGGKAVYRSSFMARSFLFVMDEEAMRTGWVRLLWLGERGEVVWENRWLVGELSTVWAMWSEGIGMHDIVQEKEGKVGGFSGEYEEWEPGEEVPLTDEEEEEGDGNGGM